VKRLAVLVAIAGLALVNAGVALAATGVISSVSG